MKQIIIKEVPRKMFNELSNSIELDDDLYHSVTLFYHGTNTEGDITCNFEPGRPKDVRKSVAKMIFESLEKW